MDVVQQTSTMGQTHLGYLLMIQPGHIPHLHQLAWASVLAGAGIQCTIQTGGLATHSSQPQPRPWESQTLRPK